MKAASNSAIDYRQIDFLLVVGFILVCSVYFFLDYLNLSPACSISQLTGQSCPSCGLTRSISLLAEGKLLDSEKVNSAGLSVLFFFIGQFFLRVVRLSISSWIFMFSLPVLFVDIILSVGWALYAFSPFWDRG